MPQTCPPFLGFTQFAHPSRCSRSLTTVCSCFCFCLWVGVSTPRRPLSKRQSLFICTDRSRYRVHTKSAYARTKSAHLLKRAHAESADFAPNPSHHRLVTIIVQWSVGSMARRIPILRFEQYCSTEATIVFALRIVATFARFFSFLTLTSSSRTCSCTQQVSRISVFPSV